MKILVIYDSYFGNTKKVAEAMFELIKEYGEIASVKEYKLEGKYDLIVIGSPTRAFSPTKEIGTFAKKLTSKQVSNVAFFDTRVDITTIDNKFLTFMEKRFGYSNDTLEKIFRRKKVNQITEAGKFYVHGNEGPLFDNELINAKLWITEAINKISIN